MASATTSQRQQAPWHGRILQRGRVAATSRGTRRPGRETTRDAGQLRAFA